MVGVDAAPPAQQPLLQHQLAVGVVEEAVDGMHSRRVYTNTLGVSTQAPAPAPACRRGLRGRCPGGW